MTAPWLALAGILAAAAALSALAVRGTIALAHRTGSLDHPDGRRKAQAVPVPKLGGLGMALAVVLPLLVIAATSGTGAPASAAAVLAPAVLALGIGAYDDHRSIPPAVRLLLQAGVGLLAWSLGTRVELTGSAGLDLLLTVAWFSVLINGVNLIDNTDGLAGATVLVSSAGCAAAALALGQAGVAALSLAIAGACAGFLWHNWHPAKVYMGDAGAYLLGTLLASAVLLLVPSEMGAAEAATIALLLVIVPIADTAFVVVRRLRAGIHPFTAGTDHLSHELIRRGLSVPVAVVTLQAASAAGAAAAVTLSGS